MSAVQARSRRLTPLIAILLASAALGTAHPAEAATYWTVVEQSPAQPTSQQSVRVWMSSDTVPGETAALEYHLVGRNRFGKVYGTWDTSGPTGANWRADIPAQPNGTLVTYQLFTRNIYGNDWHYTGFNWGYTVDDPAESTITSGPSARTNATSAAVEFTGVDASGFECALDTSDFAPCTSPVAYSGLDEGQHAVRVRALSLGRNPDPTPAEHHWLVDIAGPEVGRAEQPPALTNSRSAAFAFSSEEGATFACALDAEQPVRCSSPHTYPDLSDGRHTLRIVAIDDVGNSGPANEYTWTVDATAPELTLTLPELSAAHDVATRVEADDGVGSGITGWHLTESSVIAGPDDNAWLASPSSSFRFDGGDGPRTLYAWARDAAGNISARAEAPVVIDTTAPMNPTLASATSTGAWTRARQVTVDWSAASDAMSGLAGYSVSWTQAANDTPDDTGDLAASATSSTSPPLSDGAWWFHLRTQDRAGNWSAPARLGPFHVDATAPTGATLGGAAIGQPFQVASKVPLSWSASDAASGIASYEVLLRRARWDGNFGPRALWLAPTTATSATRSDRPGTTLCFTLRARDVAGNTALSPERCTSLPLDDHSLSASGGWTRRTGVASAYKDTTTGTSSRTADLTRTGVVARRLALLVTLVPSGGSVRVWWNGTLLTATPISLAASTTQAKQLITLPAFSSVQAGTLRIVVTTSGQRVVVDGVGIAR